MCVFNIIYQYAKYSNSIDAVVSFANGVLLLLIIRLIRVSNFIDLCFIQLCVGLDLENEIERVKAANRKL